MTELQFEVAITLGYVFDISNINLESHLDVFLEIYIIFQVPICSTADALDSEESEALLRDYSYYLKNFRRHVREKGQFAAYCSEPLGTCFHREWDMDTLERARHLIKIRNQLFRENKEFRLHV